MGTGFVRLGNCQTIFWGANIATQHYLLLFFGLWTCFTNLLGSRFQSCLDMKCKWSLTNYKLSDKNTLSNWDSDRLSVRQIVKMSFFFGVWQSKVFLARMDEEGNTKDYIFCKTYGIIFFRHSSRARSKAYVRTYVLLGWSVNRRSGFWKIS